MNLHTPPAGSSSHEKQSYAGEKNAVNYCLNVLLSNNDRIYDKLLNHFLY